MTDSRGCEHEGTKVETASNRLNGVADPEGATLAILSAFIFSSAFRALRMLSIAALVRPGEVIFAPGETDLSGIS